MSEEKIEYLKTGVISIMKHGGGFQMNRRVPEEQNLLLMLDENQIRKLDIILEQFFLNEFT